MKESVGFIVRAAILVVCCYYLYRLFPAVVGQMQGRNACAVVGFLPTCYLLFAGYLAIGLSVTMKSRTSQWFFLPAWLVVFLLALFNSILQLVGERSCATGLFSAYNCYTSLVTSIILLLAYRYSRGKRMLPF
ncbi:MAG: hypothetical protein GY820_25075 [Gammaproteobacteria bacterium]|nr:hypothetical protein [Gammaproteobacteria bacterium]